MSDKKKVLIVDDEDIVRRLVARVLSENGYEAIVAENGENGIKRMSENPDMIVTDFNYKTPGMNGVLFARRVREAGYERPIIVASSKIQEIMDTYTDAFGIQNPVFNGYLSKPFRPNQLLDELARVLAEPQSQ
ncbi:MAG: response regulator [Candidatus Aenigmatarchaeota archaeon]